MARAVRIARSENGEPGDPEAPEGYRPNTGGLTRSGRLFALFLVVLVVFYASFLGLLLTGPSAGTSPNSSSLAVLSVLGALLAVGGFWLTLARTPRGIERRTGRLVVIEFLGGRRVFPMDSTLRFTVENRYGTGLLTPVPTAMVSISSVRGPVRHYLVERDLLPDPVP